MRMGRTHGMRSTRSGELPCKPEAQARERRDQPPSTIAGHRLPTGVPASTCGVFHASSSGDAAVAVDRTALQLSQGSLEPAASVRRCVKDADDMDEVVILYVLEQNDVRKAAQPGCSKMLVHDAEKLRPIRDGIEATTD